MVEWWTLFQKLASAYCLITEYSLNLGLKKTTPLAYQFPYLLSGFFGFVLSALSFQYS